MKKEFPKLAEIISDTRFSTTASHFKDWNVGLELNPGKREAFKKIEANFQKIDDSQWDVFKNRIVSFGYNEESRGLTQFFDKCNEAEAYSFLKEKGFMDVEFIPESRISKRRTPDLSAKSQQGDVLCEVKTINISDEEARRNKHLRDTKWLPATYETDLNDGLLKQIKSQIEEANKQFDSYDSSQQALRYLYLVVNRDNPMAFEAEKSSDEAEDYIKSLRLGALTILLKIKLHSLETIRLIEIG